MARKVKRARANPFRISKASSEALEPIDTRTGEPMRKCDACGSDSYSTIVVGRCAHCNKPFARCPKCGSDAAVNRAVGVHERACLKKIENGWRRCFYDGVRAHVWNVATKALALYKAPPEAAMPGEQCEAHRKRTS